VRQLVDAHALIWAVDDPARLSAAARTALQDPANQLVVSAATVWELSIKVGLGKLILSLPYRQWTDRAFADLCLVLLPITVDYADAQATVPYHHGDPFDRMLIAQATVEGIAIVSADGQFDAYGVTRIW
jgi:PIN domain nuclease of toxin-antitoxin system